MLLRRGKPPEGSKFEARMWLGPFKVIFLEQPSNGLGNAPGRKSMKPVHFRRLRPYLEKDEESTDGEANYC